MKEGSVETMTDNELESAKQNIYEKLPFLTPQEETELVITDDQPEDALYYGEWGGRHIIGLRSTAMRTSERRLTHELIHQRFAEIVGRDRVLGDFAQRFEDMDFSEMQGSEICKILNKERAKHPPNISRELWATSESIAYLGERYIFNDTVPLKERFSEDDYPKDVLEKMIKLDEKTPFEEIPKVLKDMIN